MSAGKGDAPRPVDMATYQENYERIFRKPKEEKPPPPPPPELPPS